MCSTQLPLVSTIFRYDPYQTESVIVVEEEIFALPADTIHTQMANKVSFLPYPDEEFFAPGPSLPKDHMSRVFIGQLPYQVTDMQLQWLCSTFGNGVSVHYLERIVKHDKSGAKLATGCVHAYCRPDQVEALMDGMHKKLLIDDTGVWYAQNDVELEALSAHTTQMKKDRRKRPQNRPYDTVVAQLATSTYVPKPPSYFSQPQQVPPAPPAVAMRTGRASSISCCSSSSSGNSTPPLPSYSSAAALAPPRQVQSNIFPLHEAVRY